MTVGKYSNIAFNNTQIITKVIISLRSHNFLFLNYFDFLGENNFSYNDSLDIFQKSPNLVEESHGNYFNINKLVLQYVLKNCDYNNRYYRYLS